MVKPGGMWQSSVDSSNDHKSAGDEKRQCLEDYHQRFGLVEIWTKMMAESWSEEALHKSVSGFYSASLN